MFISGSCFDPKDTKLYHQYNEFNSRTVLLVPEIPNIVHSPPQKYVHLSVPESCLGPKVTEPQTIPIYNMGTNLNSSTKMGVGEVPEKLVEQEPKPRAARNHDNHVSGNHPGTVTLLTILEYLPYTYQRKGRVRSKQANKHEQREATRT